MARINLVTGAAGFIGAHLTRALLDRGEEVLMVDTPSEFAAPDAALRALMKRSTIVAHDLSIPLAPEFARLRVDRAFLLAGVVGVRRVLSAPETTLMTNLLVTLHTLRICESTGCRTLFFASSSEVYDASRLMGFAELEPVESSAIIIDPQMPKRSAYALSKIAGEWLTATFARRLGIDCVVARYHSIYGPRMGNRHVIPQFIERALRQEDPFHIYGHQIRHFCHVNDAIRASIALTEMKPGFGVVVCNIGNDSEATDTLILAKHIAAKAGYQPKFELHPPPEGSPNFRKPSLDLLKRLTGYQPEISLAKGLEETFSWYEAYAHIHSRRDVI